MMYNSFFLLGDEISTDYGGNTLQGIFVIIIFVAVLIAAYYTTRFVGKQQMNRTKNSNLKIVEVIQVSPGKTVQLLKAGDEFFLIGVSKENITFLKSINEESINLENMEQFKTAAVPFKDQLQKLLNKKDSKDTETK